MMCRSNSLSTCTYKLPVRVVVGRRRGDEARPPGEKAANEASRLIYCGLARRPSQHLLAGHKAHSVVLGTAAPRVAHARGDGCGLDKKGG